MKGDEPPPLVQGEAEYHPEARPAGEGGLSGVGGSPGIAAGPVRHVRSLGELSAVAFGDILVTHAIDPAWTPVFGLIAGVISEEGGILSHATVLGREYGLPVVIGVAGAARTLEPGELVEINGTTGAVRRMALEEAAAGPEPTDGRSV